MYLNLVKFTLALFICTTSYANLPDSIIISDKTLIYADWFDYSYVFIKTKNNYKLFQSSFKRNFKLEETYTKRKLIGVVPRQLISDLVKAINDTGFSKVSLAHFGYDKEWLANNKDSLFTYVRSRYEHWNEWQIQYTKQELANIEPYEDLLRNYLTDRKSEEGLNHYSRDFLVTFYDGNSKKETIKAGENIYGMPWTVNNKKSYNPGIPRIFSQLLLVTETDSKDNFDVKNVIADFAPVIFDPGIIDSVRKMAPLSFSRELKELETSFVVIKTVEYFAAGRYLWPDTQTFRITMKHPLMQKNVYLQYFISRNGSTLYPRDSVIKDAPRITERIQSIKFLMDYISEDTNRRIEINYFDNRAISGHALKNFNGSDTECNEYKQMKKLVPAFDPNGDYKHSNCGCDFGFPNDYLKKSVFFELFDEEGNGSIWILLPDNTPVLHFFEGEKVYKYSSKQLGTKGVSVQDACKKFDKDGNIIN